MAESELLKKITAGAIPKHIRLLAAGGMLPLPAGELLQIVVTLAHDPDPEVAQKAAATLESTPEADLLPQLQARECGAAVIDHFSVSASEKVQEAIIQNPNVAGSVIARMASRLPEQLLELVLDNRTRILETPEILHSIRQNPAATARILGLVIEIETEFFAGKKQVYAADATAAEPAPDEGLKFETENLPEDLILEGLPLDPQEREAAILNRIGSMTVRQKIQLALMGTREVRAVLIRDANKEVSRGVLQSPKLMLAEVEGFAAMRSVAEDVLRTISANKAWTKSYAVIHNLVKNPKTPATISQRLMLRLLTKDLTFLARDRGLPEAVRRNAERLLKQRKN